MNIKTYYSTTANRREHILNKYWVDFDRNNIPQALDTKFIENVIYPAMTEYTVDEIKLLEKQTQKYNTDSKLTTIDLQYALKLCNINIQDYLVGRIIDIIKLLEEKGNKTTLMDISSLKAMFNERENK